MKSLKRDVLIHRRPEEVWTVVGNFDEDPRWRMVDEMISTPPGPAETGTKTHEVLRFLGSTYVTDATVTDVEPGRSLVFEGSGGDMSVRGSRVVESDPKAHGTSVYSRSHSQVR